MNEGSTVFSQLVRFLPQRDFRRHIDRYSGNKNIRTFSCWDQFLCMAFAQLTYRESLRDIEACLRAVDVKLYHLGIRGKVSRSTLADANNTRDWRIFRDFAQNVIQHAQKLYTGEIFELEVDNAVYALDASIIDLCLSLCPWSYHKPHTQRGGIKLHALLDLKTKIPVFIDITRQKVDELSVFDQMALEADAFYIVDRGYFDWRRLYRITTSKAFFVIRPKKDVALRRLYSHPVNKQAGVLSDQIVMSKGSQGHPLKYPEKLRRVRYLDSETRKRFIFLTNHFELPAETIADLYRTRWQIELFFKWVKQHLRIKAFYGTSENAVKSQIWIAITVYVLIAIAKKRLQLPHSLYSILQVLSVTILEKKPILSIFHHSISHKDPSRADKQLEIFTDPVGH